MTNPNSIAPAVSAEPLRDSAVQLVLRLQSAGFTAFWAGGCVRDILMGTSPKDYDVVTDAPPEKVVQLFPGAVETGKAFAVIRAPLGGIFFEVATFREDHAYYDGRRPAKVSWATPETDARRRDFTVNAMFYDPVKSQIIDYVGGREDLSRRIIRSVMSPEKCFADDHLRMLRAVRFASVLGFRLDPPTADSIRQHADQISRISVDRIRDEITRILTESPRPGDALLLLDEVGLLPPVLPAAAAMKGHCQPPEFHPEGDVFQHTVAALNAIGRNPPALGRLSPEDRPHAYRQLVYSVLFHDIGKPLTAERAPDRIRYHHHAEKGAETTEAILRFYHFPTADIQAVAHCVRNHMRFMNVRNMRRSTLLQLVGAPTFPVEIELHRIDCESSHGNLDNYHFLTDFVRALEDHPALPRPWITGHDIMKLGVPHGAQVGIWKRRAYEAQLEGIFGRPEELMEWLSKELEADGAR